MGDGLRHPLRTRGPSHGQQRSQDQVNEKVLSQGPRCTALRQWAGELGGRHIASFLSLGNCSERPEKLKVRKLSARGEVGECPLYLVTTVKSQKSLHRYNHSC